MRAATALYKPVGLVLGALSGAVAGAVFKQVWKKLGHEEEAPGATDRERTWQEVSLLPCRARSSRRSTAAARRRRSA